MRSTRDFLTGILTGVAIGILTAPRSGKDTRDKLTEEANKRSADLKDQWEKGVSQAKDTFEQTKSQVQQGFEQAKGQAEYMADKAKSDFDTMKDKVANKGEQAKDNYNDNVDELAYKAKGGIEDAKDAAKAY